MQAVMAFTRRQMANRAAQGGEGFTGKQLGGMSRGVSALSSLMEYAGARQRAGAMDQEARDERLAARQEYVTAAERVNAIDAEFNGLVTAQQRAAADMGLDVGSGSVVAARNETRDAADRERRIIRNSADLNAAQRRLRSLTLRNAAKNARLGAGVAFVASLATAATGG